MSGLPILLFLGGIGLLIVELHVPGMVVFGLSGFVAIFSAIYLAFGDDPQILHIMAAVAVASAVVFFIILKKFPKTKYWNNMVLKEEEHTAGGFTSTGDFQKYLGCEGIATTLLRPAGSAEIGKDKLDVVAEGMYIAAGTTIRVVSVVGSRIVVRPVKN